MALFIECDELTEKEKEVRHNLIYLFNPCLKFIFNKRPQFKEYAYNSCRQTAIFSAAFLINALSARCTVYEASFSDVLHGKKVDYVHAFVIAEDGKNRILVDVSRTERLLLFHSIEGLLYPKVEGYMDLRMKSYEKLDFYNLFLTDEPEFLTGQRPVDVMEQALALYDNLKNKTRIEQLTFAAKIYDETTKIGGEFL